MNEKVILITIDGMRADGFCQCGNPFVEELKNISTYTLDGVNVMPAETLPCHMSLFTSTTPDIHNVKSNTYQRPTQRVKGVVEQLCAYGKHTAMFYGWDEMRDVVRPGGLIFSQLYSSYTNGYTDAFMTERTIEYIKKEKPDFLFLHLDNTDNVGHHQKWMSEAYLKAISDALDCVKTVVSELGDEYSVIVTSDHGGHEYDHGDDIPSDRIIPAFFIGKPFEGGRVLEKFSIMDIAPTITKIMDVPSQNCWLGTPVI